MGLLEIFINMNKGENMKQIIGVLLLSSPFIALAVLCFRQGLFRQKTFALR